MTAVQGEKRAGKDHARTTDDARSANHAGTADSARTGDVARTALERLMERFDQSVFDVGRPLVRIRVQDGGEPHDVVVEDGTARMEPTRGSGRLADRRRKDLERDRRGRARRDPDSRSGSNEGLVPTHDRRTGA